MTKRSSPRQQSENVAGCVDSDLQTVLMAWHDATLRWEQMHDQLQAEVRRLSAALAARDASTTHHRGPQLAGDVACRIARSVRGSLAAAPLYLNLLRRRLLDDTEALNLLRKAEDRCAEADARLDDLLQLTAESPVMLRTVHLRSLVEDVHGGLRGRLLSQGVSTVVDVPQQATVLADYEMLRQAVYNLSINALDAMPSGGELVVTSYTGHGAVELEIADSGTGLSDEAKKRAFEPFYSTKNGAGLGLSVVQRLLAAHDGTITATNCAEGGAAFTIRLPHRALSAAA